ncbi:MAG: LysR substrate-binding domain-containing protein, partial [Asticcacaulis sp.]
YLRSNSGTVLMSAVTAGLGLTVLPVYITGHYVASGKAVEVLADIDWGITPVTILMPAGRRMTRRVRALVEFLVAGLKSVNAQG